MDRPPFEKVEAELAAGVAVPSFVSMNLEEMDREGRRTPEAIETLKKAASQMWTGGAETVGSRSPLNQSRANLNS